MRYLWLNSIICLLLLTTGCSSVYRHVQRNGGDARCVEQFRPQLGTALYSTQVNILRHHLSGLLFMKQMPDSSTRVTFTNEMGFKFFDFGFSKDGVFTKYYILPKMDRKAVVKTLEQDFALVLFRQNWQQAYAASDGKYRYAVVPTEKGSNYYITDSTCTTLLRIEKASVRKPVVKAWMESYRNGVPDSIHIAHQQFRFNITLRRVER